MRISAWLSNTRLFAFILAVLYLSVCAAFVQSRPTSWNDISRVAAIESLVEQGTWTIDDSPWADETLDKVLIGGRFFSDKMPLLSFAGAGVYAVLHAGGLSLAPNCNETSGACAYAWLTLILMSLPGALLIGLFFSLARSHASLWASLAASFALGAGTMITPYALVFNHHLPGAVGLFASFAIIVAGKRGRLWMIAAGLFAALAPCFDGSSGIVSAGVALLALVRYRRDFLWFVLGAAMPVMATALIDYWMIGTVLPPYLVPGGYEYSGAAAASSAAGLSQANNLYAYAFRMFVGAQGVLAYNPLLLFALAGSVHLALWRRHPLRLAALAALGSFLLLSVYLALGTGNYGGEAYGIRFFVPAIPMLFWFLLFVPPLSGLTWKTSPSLLLLPLLAISIFSTYQGMRRPWLYTPPPVHLARLDAPPYIGVKWEVKLW